MHEKEFNIVALLVAITLAGCSTIKPSSPQETGSKKQDITAKYTKVELIEDVNFLFESMERVHPNLYAYSSKEGILKEREKLERELSTPITKLEFYKRLAPVIIKLRDGHTWAYFPEEEFRHFKQRDGLLFPLDLEFQSGNAYIVSDYSYTDRIPRGAILHKINNVPIKQIVDQIMPYIAGQNEAFRVTTIQNHFRDWLWLTSEYRENFDIVYSKNEYGSLIETSKRGVTAQVVSEKSKNASASRVPPLRYEENTEEGYGKITLNRFRSQNRSFEDALEKIFAQIKENELPYLIIDLRNSEGGDSRYSNMLLEYITDKPYGSISHLEVRRSQLPWSLQLASLTLKLHPKSRKIINKQTPGIVMLPLLPQKPKPNKQRFRGGVYVLIGPKVFSTATMFAVAIKDYEIGTLIGTETGGLANHYGDRHSFELPNTGLECRVSYKYFVRPSGAEDHRGVLPDIEVPSNSEYIAQGRDPVMEIAHSLIRKTADADKN